MFIVTEEKCFKYASAEVSFYEGSNEAETNPAKNA